MGISKKWLILGVITIFVVLALSGGFSSLSILDPTDGTATIEGHVFYWDGTTTYIENATIDVGGVYSTTTDINGDYEITGIAPGEYLTTWSKAGFISNYLVLTYSENHTVRKSPELIVDSIAPKPGQEIPGEINIWVIAALAGVILALILIPFQQPFKFWAILLVILAGTFYLITYGGILG